MTTLICGKCKESLPSSSFSNAEQRKSDKRWCRPCRAKYMREWRSKNYERDKGYREKYLAKPGVRERQRERDRARSSSRQGKQRSADAWFRYRYGLTVDEIDAMIEEQGGVCAICCKPEERTDPRTGNKRRLQIDHDHRTGRPRAMLCQGCNWVLARVDDSVELLHRFIAYLDRGDTPTEG